MGQDHRTARQAPREAQAEGAVSVPLGLPTAPPLAVWEELAEEAERYAALLRAWKGADATERPALETELVGLLSDLRVHSTVMDDAVEEAMDLADRLEDHELARQA